MSDTTLITRAEHNPAVLPQVEEALHLSGAVIIGNFARVKDWAFEVYVPAADRESGEPGGGFIELSEVQARHVYNQPAHLFMGRAKKEEQA